MRPATAPERARLAQALLDHFKIDVEAWLGQVGGTLWVDRSGPPRYYWVAEPLHEQVLALGAQKPPTVAGLWVAELGERDFRLSLEGAFVWAHLARRNRVWLGDASAQRFLYGRDMREDSIERADAAPLGPAVIVLNRHGHALGLASPEPGNAPGKGRLKALRDRGWYLREGG